MKSDVHDSSLTLRLPRQSHDVTADGQLDLVVAHKDRDNEYLPISSRPSTPHPLALRSAEVSGGEFRLSVGDINEDGKPDIVTSNFEGDSISVLSGR